MRKFLLVLLAILTLATGCLHKQHNFGPPSTNYNRTYKQIIKSSEFNYCYLTPWFSVAVEDGVVCPNQDEVEVSALLAASIHGKNLDDMGYPMVIFTNGSFRCGRKWNWGTMTFEPVQAIGCTIVGGEYDDFILVDIRTTDPSWNWVMQHEFFHQWLSTGTDGNYHDGDVDHSHPSWVWAY